jgi:preprotein translocase subunit SecB
MPIEEKKVLIKVLTQHIKDLSFENYAAQNHYSEKIKPIFDINLKVETKDLHNKKYEVTLIFLIESFHQREKIFLIELSYSAIYEIENAKKSSLKKLLMVECPRFIYPFARKLIFDISRDGGYPPINLDIIDFEQLYKENYH